MSLECCQNTTSPIQLVPNQQQILSVQRQYQSQYEQRQQLQFQLEQRRIQSQPIQRQLPCSQLRQEQQHQQQDKEKKKKCRGDRRGQRYRAKLRKRGLNDDEITALTSHYNNANQGQNENQCTIPDMDVELLVPIHVEVGSI